MADEQYYALCVEKEDGSTQIAFFELGGDALPGALGISVYTAPDGELQRRHLQDGQVVIVAKSPRDLLSVDVDTARYAGVHRLEKIPGALRGYNDLAVLQMPALQLAVGGGVDRDPQRPRERVSAEFKEGYLRRAVLLFYAERVVLFVRHAFSSLTVRQARRAHRARRVLQATGYIARRPRGRTPSGRGLLRCLPL